MSTPEFGPQGDSPEAQEKGETIQKTPVYVIYRDNDLYSRWGDFIVDTISEAGFEVEKKVFDKETGQQEIHSWMSETNETGDFAEKTLLTDETCSGRNTHNLDGIMKNSTADAVAGINLDNRYEEAPEDMQENIEFQRDIFRGIIRGLPEDMIKGVNNVYIMTQGDTLLSAHDYGPDDIDASEKYAKMIAGELVDGGFKGIRIVDDLRDIPEEHMSKDAINQHQTLLIYNRHNDYGKLEDSALLTPVETFMDDAQTKFGVQVEDNDAFSKALKKRLIDYLENYV